MSPKRIPEIFEFPAVLPRTSPQQRTMADTNSDAAVVAVPETWHVNPYQEKFNPLTKAGQAIFETNASLQQRKIPGEFVAYYEQNLHR